MISLCASIDALIDGGAAPGDCIELDGARGGGKTQLALQAAVNAAIPSRFGGVGGACLYIDGECAFVPERARQLAAALARRLADLHAADGADAPRRKRRTTDNTRSEFLHTRDARRPREQRRRATRFWRAFASFVRTRTLS